MADVVGSINFDTSIDTDSIEHGFDDIGEIFKKLTDVLEKLSESLNKFFSTETIEDFSESVEKAFEDVSDAAKTVEEATESVKESVEGVGDAAENSSDKIKASFDSVGQTVDEVSDTVDKYADALDGAIGSAQSEKAQKLQSKFLDQQAAIQKTNSELELAKEKYDQLVSGEETPKSVIKLQNEFKRLQKDIENTQKEYDALIAKEEELVESYNNHIQTGTPIPDDLKAEIDATNAKFKVTGELLDSLSGRLDAVTQKLSDVNANPEAPEEVKRLAAEIENLQLKLDKLNLEAAFTAQNIKVEDAKQAQEAAENAKKLSDESGKAKEKLSDACKSASCVNESLKKSTTSLSKFTKRIAKLAAAVFIFNVIRRGLNDLRKYIGSLLNTNASFVTSLNQVKSNLLIAFQPIIDRIIPIITKLISALATATGYIAAFTSALFGTTISQSTKAAKALNDQAKATSKLGSAAAKAAKQLAPFDEINQFSSDGGGGSAGGGAAGFEITEPEIDTSGIDMFVEHLQNAFTYLRDWFNREIRPYVIDAWMDIIPQLQNLQGVFFKTWNNIKELGTPLQAWFEQDFTPFFQQLIKTAGVVSAGLLETFSMVFDDVMNSFVIPLADSFLTTILPTFTQFSTEAIATFEVLFTSVKSIFDSIWRTGVAPALEIISKIWTEAWESIQAFWDAYGARIFEQVRTAIQKTGDTLQHVWEEYLQPIWERFMELVDRVWTNHLKPLLDNFLDFVGEFVLGALTIYNEFILPIINWLVDAFAPAFKEVFSVVADFVEVVIADMTQVINGIIKVLKGVIDFIVGVFTGDWERAWEGIGKIFEGIWEGVEGFFRGTVNTLIGIINVAISAIISAVNGVINALNTLKLEIPPWVPIIGGKGISFNIKKAPPVSIPYLATGTVVPPNAPFMAMLGDNTKEHEVVSPLSTIEQAVENVLSRTGMNGNGNITVVLELSGKEIARTMIPYLDEANNRIGTRLSNRAVMV